MTLVESTDSVAIRSNYLVKVDEKVLISGGFKPHDQLLVRVMRLDDVSSGKFTVTLCLTLREDLLMKLPKKVMEEKGLKPGDKIILRIAPFNILEVDDI